jgi:hypothetical protein
MWFFFFFFFCCIASSRLLTIRVLEIMYPLAWMWGRLIAMIINHGDGQLE